MFVDAMKRPWQLGTLQVDPNLPGAFKLEYFGEDNKEHKPVMLHRAIWDRSSVLLECILSTRRGISHCG